MGLLIAPDHLGEFCTFVFKNQIGAIYLDSVALPFWVKLQTEHANLVVFLSFPMLPLSTKLVLHVLKFLFLSVLPTNTVFL